MAVTPTFGEYVWSHVNAPWKKFEVYDPRTPWEDQETIDYRAEQALYHNIDLTLALAAFGVRAYYVGGYAATNTFGFYRLASTMNSIWRVASVAASPVGITVASVALIGYGYVKASESQGGFASPNSSGIGLSPGNPRAYDELTNMTWSDLWPF